MFCSLHLEKEHRTVSKMRHSSMDAGALYILLLLLTPVVIKSWQTLDSSSSQEIRKPIHPYIHYHSKRHMLPRDSEIKTRVTTQRPKNYRKRVKPTGYLKPLQEDDIQNDEVFSVAINPPVNRPKYDKLLKFTPKTINRTTTDNSKATDIIRDVLVQLGREFVSHQVNEDFVFGQYVGNSMKNLTSDLRLKMQHEILDLIVKYQKLGHRDVVRPQTTNATEENTLLPMIKEIKTEKRYGNETEESWPDFSNLAKIVG